jgi:anti-sigma28 factor (negative regulator of flagellin synthesis)
MTYDNAQAPRNPPSPFSSYRAMMILRSPHLIRTKKLLSTGCKTTKVKGCMAHTAIESMKVNDLQIATARAQKTEEDVHLSELVRRLRWLASNSPERQARIEQIARSYANGTYRPNPEATASKILDDGLEF